MNNGYPGLQERLKTISYLEYANFNEWLDNRPAVQREACVERILAQSIEVYQRKEEVVWCGR